MFDLLQDDKKSAGSFTTPSTHVGSRGSSATLVVFDFGLGTGVASTNSSWVDPNCEWGSDESENQSDDNKHGEQALVDDACTETDVEHNEFNKTFVSDWWMNKFPALTLCTT